MSSDIAERFSRTGLLLGENAAELQNKRVLIVGVGGVGGYAVENIVRAGVGCVVMVDGDDVDVTNCNRQIIALSETIGKAKVDVWVERCRQINPDGDFIPLHKFLKSAEDIDALLREGFDFVIDAIDDVPVKVELICQLKRKKIPFISSMGAGGKIDPMQVKLADLSKTSGCPLARVMRNKLKERRLQKGIPTVYSPEVPLRSFESKKIGSISYLPAIFGCFCAASAISALCGTKLHRG